MKKLNLISQKFGKLTVLSLNESKAKNGGKRYNCRCECGSYIIKNSGDLSSGKSWHCGCGVLKNRLQIGAKFNRYIILRQISTQERKDLGYKDTSIYYLCKCDCGNERIVKSSALRNNLSKSCGCIKEQVRPKANLITLYKQYIKSANYRNISFKLSIEDFEKITSSNCSYCGDSPSTIMVQKLQKSEAIPYIYNGIDRVDSSIGYTFNNCLPSCNQCNIMKLDYSFEEFIDKIKQIYKYSNGG